MDIAYRIVTKQVVNSIEQGDEIISITVEGDDPELMAKMKSRIDEWNSILG